MSGRVNRYGRRPGRGWRPWLLLPKVLAIGVFFGGMAAVAVILLTTSPGDEAQWRQMTTIVARLYWFLVIPGATAAVVLGVGLLLDHPRIFLRLRWLQVKLVLVVVALGGLHVVSNSLMQQLRDTGEGLPNGARLALGWVTVAGIVMVGAIIIIGRHKPRLGQNWGRAYPARPGEAPSRPAERTDREGATATGAHALNTAGPDASTGPAAGRDPDHEESSA